MSVQAFRAASRSNRPIECDRPSSAPSRLVSSFFSDVFDLSPSTHESLGSVWYCCVDTWHPAKTEIDRVCILEMRQKKRYDALALALREALKKDLRKRGMARSRISTPDIPFLHRSSKAKR